MIPPLVRGATDVFVVFSTEEVLFPMIPPLVRGATTPGRGRLHLTLRTTCFQ